jgi:hypothetical protein
MMSAWEEGLRWEADLHKGGESSSAGQNVKTTNSAGCKHVEVRSRARTMRPEMIYVRERGDMSILHHYFIS